MIKQFCGIINTFLIDSVASSYKNVWTTAIRFFYKGGCSTQRSADAERHRKSSTPMGLKTFLFWVKSVSPGQRRPFGFQTTRKSKGERNVI